MASDSRAWWKNRLLLIPLVMTGVLVTSSSAPRCEAPEAPGKETLTLDQAVALALEHNRAVLTARWETEKSEERVAAARTRLLPVPQINAIGSRLLSDVGFEFPRGAFGDFPTTGPIPREDTVITSPTGNTLFVDASLMQPLTQLYGATLGIKLNRAALELDQEKAREQRQSVVQKVKKLYFSLLQTESARSASQEAVAFYRELDRVVGEFVAQKAALPVESLDARARLSAEEYRSLTLANAVATQKEQLNDLMGRDIRTEFDLVSLPEMGPLEVDLEGTRSQALERRPEIRQARLRIEQADLDRRIKKSEFLPDLSVGYGFLTTLNMDVLPRDISAVRLAFSWELFDWGRRRRELAEKRWAVDQAKLGLQTVQNAVLLEVDSRFRALQESRTFVPVSQLALDAAREKSRVAMDRYKQRAILLKDLLQSQSDLAEATDRHEQALLSVWSARADLEKALGEE